MNSSALRLHNLTSSVAESSYLKVTRPCSTARMRLLLMAMRKTYGGDVAVEPLIAALKDSDTEVCEAAEGTITHIGTPKAKRALEEYQRQRLAHVAKSD